MRKETTIIGKIDEALFRYEGTEMIDIANLMELTDGHPLEITFKSEDGAIEGTLILQPFLKTNHLTGQVIFKTVEREPEE